MSNKDDRHERLIRDDAGKRYGLMPDSFTKDECGAVVAIFGTWVSNYGNNEHGFEVGDEGELSAQVAGSPKYGNERVAYIFTPAGFDPYTGPKLVPFEDIEPVGE